MKTAYHATGKRPASTLTYKQWCAQVNSTERAKSAALTAKEADKYAPRSK